VRVLHVIHSLDRERGGPAEGVRQLVAAGSDLGDAHEVLTLDSPEAMRRLDLDAALYALGPAHGRYGWTPRLGRWLRAHASGCDALIVHGLWQYHGLAVRRAALHAAVPYYVFCHGMLDPWFRKQYPLKHLKKLLYWKAVEHRVLRDAQAVLFTTEEEARLAPASFGSFAARTAVVGFGVELDASAESATAEAFLARHPESRGRRNVIFLGRLHPKKGCDLLLDAYAQVARNDPRLHLVMAGPDQVGWRAGLDSHAQRLGIDDRISWSGMLEGPLKWSALHAAEVFVLPSHQENFGIAVAEALAVGVPVLVSDKVNIWREVVADGAGFADADTLAGTVTLLRRWLDLSGTERAAMRDRARACYASRFRMAATARRLRDAMRANTVVTGSFRDEGLATRPE